MKTFVEIFRNVPTQWHNPKDAILWDKIGWSLSNERAIALTNGMEDFSVEKRINSLFNDYKDESFLCADRPENKICEAKWRDQYLPFLISKSMDLSKDPSQSIEYHPAEHRFRFAAWCAATAGRSSRSVCTFPVSEGAGWLKNTSLKWLALGTHALPEPEDFEVVHDSWCREIKECETRLTYGIAAKIVNCYTKALFLSDMLMVEPKPFRKIVRKLHPPIDRVLLNELTNRNVGGLEKKWRLYMKKGWSKFNKEDYEEVIRNIKNETDNQPALIEAYWQGYQ